ncbi:MAG: hypothetical protein R6X16_04490 [Anaerolineae bacterium]
MKTNRENALSMGLFLIGIGLIFLLPGVGFWPWILVVLAIAGLPNALSRGRDWMAWQSTFWLIGLALLFAFDVLWPGVLLLAGVSVLFGGLRLRHHLSGASADEAPEVPADPVDLAWRDLSAAPLDVEEPLFEDAKDGTADDAHSATPSVTTDSAGNETHRF